MSHHNKEILAFGLSVMITGAAVAAAFMLFNGQAKFLIPNIQNNLDSSPNNLLAVNPAITARKSEGERLIMVSRRNTDKEEGIKLYAQKNYAAAVAKWQTYLDSQGGRTDPEARIYFNNAQIAEKDSAKIAVVVPVGSNREIAEEILRGVSQLQTEVNSQGGVNGKLIKIAILNDDNLPDVAQDIAQYLVNDKTFLAVVGHNASDASKAAAPIYEKGGLVMVSPTSKSKDLTGSGKYIFRTVASIVFEVDLLYQYSIKNKNANQIAICLSGDNLSLSMRDALVNRPKFNPIPCSLASSNFDADAIANQLLNAKIDALIIAGGTRKDYAENSIKLAKALKNRMVIMSDSSLYTKEPTLTFSPGASENMVISIPWHPEGPNSKEFADKAEKIWGGRVNWRSATAYDALLAISTALKANPTREGIQQSLSSKDFAVDGAAGTIRFSSDGDTQNRPILVKVTKKEPSQSGTGYDFIPF
ncbi:MAG: ABC transporter substrate-binding protein [Pseudanabaena sp. ELA607]|jgi:branched-chain amino acid transport system substrate-binding protein